MSLLIAFLVAATPAAAAPEPAAKKPRLRCEWIHEVGTSRPRRVCEKRPDPRPAEQAKDAPKAEPAATVPAAEGSAG